MEIWKDDDIIVRETPRDLDIGMPRHYVVCHTNKGPYERSHTNIIKFSLSAALLHAISIQEEIFRSTKVYREIKYLKN